MKKLRLGEQIFINITFADKSVRSVGSVKAEFSVALAVKLNEGKGGVVFVILFEIAAVNAAAFYRFNQEFTGQVIANPADEGGFQPCLGNGRKHIQRCAACFADKAHIANRVNPVRHKIYENFSEGGYVIFSHGNHPFD